MAAPYTFEATFEDGTTAPFDSESDADSKLNVRHYTQLYGSPVHEMPYRGAYAAEVNLALSTTDAYVEEAIAFALAASGALRFYVYAQDLTMAASDRFTIATLLGTGTSELVVDIRNNAGKIEILAAETGAAATVRATSLVQNQWHAVELVFTIDSGGGNDGTVSFYVDGRPVGAAITSLNQAAIDALRVGVIGQDAGTTAGYLLFDNIVVDATRIYPFDDRYPATRHITSSEHIALGPGQLEEVYLRDGGSGDSTLTLYDTDRAELSASPFVQIFDYTSGGRWGDPWLSGASFAKGVYAVFTGTNPQAWITIRHGNMSVGNVKDVAARMR